MPDRRVVAIHQPNCFPWLGYFDKLARADTFVLLDGVQFARRHGGGGNWVNRVRVLVAGVASWITAPVKRANIPLQSIVELEIADEMPWRTQLLRTLKVQYARAPHFAEAMDLIAPLRNIRPIVCPDSTATPSVFLRRRSTSCRRRSCARPSLASPVIRTTCWWTS